MPGRSSPDRSGAKAGWFPDPYSNLTIAAVAARLSWLGLSARVEDVHDVARCCGDLSVSAHRRGVHLVARRPQLRLLAALAALSVTTAAPIAAQSIAAREIAALKLEVAALRQQQAALQKQIDELRAAITGPGAGAAANLTIDASGAPAKGSATARVTIVEFSDYQCPFCSRHTRATFPQIDAEYVRTGKVRYVFRDYPIVSSHPQAFKAHEAALCSGDQGKYWEMHERLFENPRALAPANLVAYAAAVGLDGRRFQQCLDSGRHADFIRKGLSDGRTAGVTGTPTFFIGTSAPGGRVKVARVLRGAQPYARFKDALDALLAQP